MTFYIEYTVPAEGQEGARIPLNEEEPGYTIPVAENEAAAIRVSQLPARSAVAGTDLGGAKAAAEEVISHSKAKEARLFEDEEGSLEAGSGRLVSVFSEGQGWSDR